VTSVDQLPAPIMAIILQSSGQRMCVDPAGIRIFDNCRPGRHSVSLDRLRAGLSCADCNWFDARLDWSFIVVDRQTTPEFF
jgi:hypothetical protein